MREAGFTVKEMVECGFDAKVLMLAGYTAQEMEGSFPHEVMVEIGSTEHELVEIALVPSGRCEWDGLTMEEMREQGCAVSDMKRMGCTVRDMREAVLFLT